MDGPIILVLPMVIFLFCIFLFSFASRTIKQTENKIDSSQEKSNGGTKEDAAGILQEKISQLIAEAKQSEPNVVKRCLKLWAERDYFAERGLKITILQSMADTSFQIRIACATVTLEKTDWDTMECDLVKYLEGLRFQANIQKIPLMKEKGHD